MYRAFARPLAFVAAAAVVVPLWSGLVAVAPPAHANGCITPAAGTAQDPFLITTPGNLDCLVGNDLDYWGQGYHFRQTADINMGNQAPWTRGIGSSALPFNGTYDGNGFTISNLTISSAGDGVGVFGVTTGATLKDITLTGLEVSGDEQVGGLVGLLDGGVVEEASVSGDVTGGCSSIMSLSCAIGGLIGQVDDSVATTIARSTTSGSVTATYDAGSSLFGKGAGGLVGQSSPTTLTISDSSSTAQVSGYNYVGGLVGVHIESTGNEGLNVTRAFAVGQVSAVLGTYDGGLVGCFYDNFISNMCDTPYGSVTFTDVYWDTQTTGQNTSAANLGTAKTTSQMTTSSTHSGWSIVETTPDANVTWGMCAALNSGYPFLQWAAIQQGSTCTAPNPPAPPAPAPVPASPPTAVQATPGDAVATITWTAPSSTGSYPVSTYLVTSTPDSRTCLNTTTSCLVTGLRNATPYTFTVQALTGAGWSPASQPSPAIVPSPERTIVISGSRQGRTVAIRGSAQGLTGEQLTVMTRVKGERTYVGRGAVSPNSRGTFSWTTFTGKTVHVYVQGPDLRSNRITIHR